MKNVLILGATSAVGVAVARVLALRGWNLFLAARDLAKLAPIAVDLGIRSQRPVESVAFDVLNFESHQAFYDNLPSKPDVVICVVGFLGQQEQAMEDFSHTQQIINSNYTGPVSILNVVANDFASRGAGGTIIGVSSVAGDRGRQSNYYYGSAKAAFTAYLSGIRSRLSKLGSHVVTVKPGFIDTAMTAEMNLPPILTATPDQVAADIIAAMDKSKDVIYTRWFWRWIMLVIKHIPEFIFKRLSI